MAGRCDACGRLGPPHRTTNFLCTQCVHPNEIRTYCTRCGCRSTLDTASALALLARMLPGTAPEVGTVLRITSCATCITAGAPLGTITIFRVRHTSHVPLRDSLS